jgi:hypothetical protein
MTKELLSIVEGEDENRFLGAVISVRRFSNPAEPDFYEIVDGQQRLATLFLFVVAGALVAAKTGDTDYAMGLAHTNLIFPYWKNKPNTKFVPSYGDRSQFHVIFTELYKVRELASTLPEQTRLPEPTGNSNGPLLRQFQRVTRFLQQQVEKGGDGGLARLKFIIEIAITRLTFVLILLRDPATATTVFEGLNDPGMPITIGDLVRNEIFSRIGDQADKAAAIHSTRWIPFETALGDSFGDYFFPFCVIQKPSTLRAGMFKELVELWGRTKEPEEIINDLTIYVPSFMAIAKGEVAERTEKGVRDAIVRLVRMGRPSAVYPFVMRLLREHEQLAVDAQTTVEILSMIEAFLVRRALAGIEPTGLLGLFRLLWSNATPGGRQITPNAVADVILRRLTIEWPDDHRLKEQVAVRPLYQSAIVQYVLLEYERSLGADFPDGTIAWIEHIAPQRLTPEWQKDFPPAIPRQLLDTWANLIPLSSGMNQELSQKDLC